MTVESAAKKLYAAGKIVASDITSFGGKALSNGLQKGGEVAQKIGEKTVEAYKGSARALYEHGRLKLLDTSNSPVFFDQKQTTDTSLISVAVPLRMEGKRWRAIKTASVWDNWGPDYPAVLVELEDPNPNFEGEEAIRLTAHGKARTALGSSEVAWRMWMPGRYQIKVDVNGTVIDRPQAEMTAGDVVSLLADTVVTESGGDLTISHRDLLQALMMISQKSGTLERRWAILEERLKLNKNLVNKPEEVAGALLTMMLVDQRNAEAFVRDVRDGKVTGWSSLIDRASNMANIRVYGSFANLLSEGQRMLPRPQDPNESYRMPVTALLGSYQILRYINWILDNDAVLGPKVKELATMTIENQKRALAVGKALLEARGQGLDEVAKRIKSATPKLVNQMGAAADATVAELGRQMSGEITTGGNQKPAYTVINNPAHTIGSTTSGQNSGPKGGTPPTP